MDLILENSSFKVWLKHDLSYIVFAEFWNYSEAAWNEIPSYTSEFRYLSEAENYAKKIAGGF